MSNEIDYGKKIDRFAFFRSYQEAGALLQDPDRLAFYDAIIDYGLDNLEPTIESLSPQVLAVFKGVRPNIENSRKTIIKNSENGKKGGAPKGNQNARKRKSISEADYQALRGKYALLANEALERYSVSKGDTTSPGVLEALMHYCESNLEDN